MICWPALSRKLLNLQRFLVLHSALADCLLTRGADLARAVDRLKLITSHDALVLLKNSLSIHSDRRAVLITSS